MVFVSKRHHNWDLKMKTEADILVVIFLCIITLLTTLCNVGVIVVITLTRKLRVPANYLICSLAVTDLLVAILVMPPAVLYIATKQWPLGDVLCKAWISIDVTCCTCSILHLCVIALDRYRSINTALEYVHKRTPQLVGVMVTIVWTISILITVPSLFLWSSHNDTAGTGNRSSQCFIQHNHIGYTIYSTCGAFYIPMTLILILYCRIFIKARTFFHKHRGSWTMSEERPPGRKLFYRSSSTTSKSDASKLNSKRSISTSPSLTAQTMDTQSVKEKIHIYASREKKATYVLGLLLGAFILCWLPFFVIELLSGLKLLKVSSLVMDITTWLGYINSLINPLLYTSFSEDFKRAFKRLLSCKRCR